MARALKHNIIVIKITGDIFNFPIDIKRLKGIINILNNYIEKNNAKIIVITGGGKNVKQIIERLRREEYVNEYMLDMIGIEMTRLHALIFISLIKSKRVSKIIPTTIDEVFSYLATNDIVVLGGIMPGVSTNTVSALIAEAVNADKLINMSRAGGIYDKDPEKYPSAKVLSKIHINDLIKLLNEPEIAGYYPLFDKVSLNIILRSKIDTYVIPPDPNHLQMLLAGKKVGSRIIFNEFE